MRLELGSPPIYSQACAPCPLSFSCSLLPVQMKRIFGIDGWACSALRPADADGLPDDEHPIGQHIAAIQAKEVELAAL